MPAEQRLLREVVRRIKWKPVEGLWTESLDPDRYKSKPPAPAPDTTPDPPPLMIMRDAPLVTGPHGESMVVIGPDGEPTLLLYRSPRYPATPPVLSDRSPTPPPPPPPSSVPISDHASTFRAPDHSPPPPPTSATHLPKRSPPSAPISPPHVPTPPDSDIPMVTSFDWRMGCYVGIALLSVYIAWRCYGRWGNAGGDQGGGPGPGPWSDNPGLVDAVLAPPTVAGHEGGKPILLRRNQSNLPSMSEFSEVDQMVKVGEVLFGPYAWARFDLMVLRPSFPYGGMEGPRMVFLKPTVIQGDASGAQVVAPQLSRSLNEDLCLNEGFITYAEKRILELVQGEEQAALNLGNGWRGLNRMMQGFNDNLEFANMAGTDPDSLLLCCIERKIGPAAFDEFLKKCICNFKFQSIDKETFLEFLKANVPPGTEYPVDLELPIEGTGIPLDAMEPDSAIHRKICSLAAEFKSGNIPTVDEMADWHGQEWELYLKRLSADDEATQVTALEERYKLSKSPYYKVQVAFLQSAIPRGYRCSFNGMQKCLKIVGRLKYLRLNPQQPLIG